MVADLIIGPAVRVEGGVEGEVRNGKERGLAVCMQNAIRHERRAPQKMQELQKNGHLCPSARYASAPRRVEALQVQECGERNGGGKVDSTCEGTFCQ